MEEEGEAGLIFVSAIIKSPDFKEEDSIWLYELIVSMSIQTQKTT